MRLSPAIVAAAFLATAAVPAQAGPVPVDTDLRCLAVMASLAGNASGEEQNRLMGGVLYFVGLIEGKAPGINLPVELKRVSGTMSDSDFEQESQRCGQILVDQGKQLDAIGQALEPSK